MTPTEAGALFRIYRGAFAHAKYDEFTPDVWAEVLGDLPFADARAALIELTKTKPYIAVSDIRAEVNKIRRRRLAAYGPITPPDELADDPAGYSAWIRETTKAIADGTMKPEDKPAELTGDPTTGRRMFPLDTIFRGMS